MKKYIGFLMLLISIFFTTAYAGINDRFSDIELSEDNYISVPERATDPPAPPSGKLRFYSKIDNLFYFINSAGVVALLGSGGGEWGSITGTLADQTDLQDELDGKVNNTGDEVISGIKTHSSFIVTPSGEPTTDYQVANKKYVDDNSGGNVTEAGDNEFQVGGSNTFLGGFDTRNATSNQTGPPQYGLSATLPDTDIYKEFLMSGITGFNDGNVLSLWDGTDNLYQYWVYGVPDTLGDYFAYDPVDDRMEVVAAPTVGGGITEVATQPAFATMDTGDIVMSTEDDTMSIKTASGGYRVSATYTGDPGQTCSGTVQDGDNESFEAGTGLFCTAGYTETDTEGIVDTYNVEQAHCGSYSMKIENHTSTESYVEMSFTDDTAFTLRYYFRFDTMPDDFDTVNLTKAVDSGLNIEDTIIVRHTTGSAYTLYFDNNVTSNFAVSEDTWYYLVLSWDGTGTVNGSTLKLYNEAGTPQAATSGLDGTTLGMTQDDGISSIRFVSDASISTWYADDVVYSAAAADLSGGETCD